MNSKPVSDDVVERTAKYLGWFDAPGQDKPAHDPKLCVLCGGSIEGRALYRSMMPMGGNKSYFFGYHEGCKDAAALDAFEEKAADVMFGIDRPN